jgi:hypothetical protein
MEEHVNATMYGDGAEDKADRVDAVLAGGATQALTTPDAQPIPSSARAARRTDNVGLIAAKLCADPPDFTAGPLLVEAVRETHGDRAADDLSANLAIMLENVPLGILVSPQLRQMRGIVLRLRRTVRRICAAYLVDLTSACGVLARIVELSTQPAQPLPQSVASVNVLLVAVPGVYAVGDRVRVPDGRLGVVVADRDAEGRYGVMLTENDEPSTEDGYEAGDEGI